MQAQHADLRNELIIAAEAIIDRDGPEALSLILTAKEVGVSSAACGKHFENRDELVKAVKQRKFQALTRSIEQAATQAQVGSIDHIFYVINAYAKFAVNHANTFDLMWSGTRDMEIEGSEEALGYVIIQNAVKTWFEINKVTQSNPECLTVKLWGLVHGLSTLMLMKDLPSLITTAEIESLIESSVRTFLSGVVTESTATQL